MLADVQQAEHQVLSSSTADQRLTQKVIRFMRG